MQIYSGEVCILEFCYFLSDQEVIITDPHEIDWYNNQIY